ncbi:MAG: efflux transporter, family, subunit [Vampirovibrio sp.]|jgi:membrane fusion protein (multidrug efflux system)|nr:efflux transporter, family, subunit [Vampirovibrio sp.]
MPLSNLLLSPKNRLLILNMALLITLTGCGGGGGWQMPPPVVDVVAASQQPWIVEYQASGTLEANNKVDLNSEIAGTITHISVREGDSVQAGQSIMRLKADKQLAQLQQSAAGITASQGNIEQQKADISQAAARLNSAAVKMRLTQSELQRYERLYADQFISQLELDQKRSNYDTAVADHQEALQALSSAKARYSQAASGLAQARSSYRYNVALADESVIRAPFTGIVGQKYVDLGDYVAPTEKLVTVVDPSLFKLQFTVPEQYLHRLRVGQPIRATFEGLGNTSFSGSVNFIDPVVDMAAHTVTVKAILPGSKQLRHGLFGTVNLALGTIQNAVVIPEEAIVPQGEKTFVYVVRHEVYTPTAQPDEKEKAAPAKPQAASPPTDVAHLQEVTVGHRSAGKVQIQSGLAAGDRVIVNGLQKVNDNMQVNLNAGKAGAGAKGQ